MVSDQPIANRITVNSAEHDDLIESVTVFRSNRAEIKRRVDLELKRGQNHIRIERLPSAINEDSIRVDGTGTAIIFDVVYHAPSHDTNSLASTTGNLRRALEALQKERSIVQAQSEFLTNYGRTLDSKAINLEDIQRFLDMFTPRQLEVAKRIQELDIQIDQAQSELNEAQIKEYEGNRGVQRGAAVTVTVLADTDGPVQLMLAYVVSDANWTPLYDVRTSIAKTPEGTSAIALHYRASITQTTGENWSDVALTLSTASPQLGSNVPKLSPWRIGISARMAIESVRARSAPLAMTRSIRSAIGQDPGVGIYAAPRARMTVRQARVENTGVLNATFNIPGRSNIPSDEGSHKVVITVLDLEADLEWICVPKEKESVFLNCKVVNSSDFTLLPGEASVFMDDNFVSRSQIEHVSPNESFKVSLGVDSALHVTYPTAKILNRTVTQYGFLFLTWEEQNIYEQSQIITVRNTRPTSVSVRILDHVPTSTDAHLKVKVVLPIGLGVPTPLNENDEGGQKKGYPWNELEEGTKARWAPLEIGGEGAVEWICDIAPFDEASLELAWEVSTPAGKKWQNV